MWVWVVWWRGSCFNVQQEMLTLRCSICNNVWHVKATKHNTQHSLLNSYKHNCKLSWRFNTWRVVCCFWIQCCQRAAATKSQQLWLQLQSRDKQGHTTTALRQQLQCTTGIIDITWWVFCNEEWHVNTNMIPFFCNQLCTDTNHGIPNTCCGCAACQCFMSMLQLLTRTKPLLLLWCWMWCCSGVMSKSYCWHICCKDNPSDNICIKKDTCIC